MASTRLAKALVDEVSSCLRKVGCRCVLDEQVRNECRSKLIYSVLIGLSLWSLKHMIVMSLWVASLRMSIGWIFSL